MDSRELELKSSQTEIEDLKILNEVYGETLKRKTREYSKFLTSEKNNTAKLQGRREVIRVIKWNLKARKERIDYLKSRIEELKKSIEKGGYSAFDILDRKGCKPKEFFVDSNYI